MDTSSLTILADEPIGVVSPLLHGHFAEHVGRCCVDGLWVGAGSPIPNEGGLNRAVVAALRELGVPILRWPGGCYADTYHWRDGVGPAERRPRSLGESCGLRVVEDNGMGTHEFVQLCREIGAEPYLAGNVGSGSPQEMMDWVHYCNGALDTTLARERAANGHPESMRVRYWGVGNENWGCGGNYEAADYAKEFRRFATFLKMADGDIELVACGDCNQDWNLKLVETLRNHLGFVDHLSVHRYYTAGPAVDFGEEDYYKSMRAGELIESDIRYTDELLRYFAAGRKRIKIAFDEWGVWHPEARGGCNYQAPNTQRDAVAAAGVLDAFHRQCDALSMANIAQIVNVLQTLIETDEDRIWLTPTYHLFRLYKPHRGGTAVRVDLDCPSVEGPALGTVKAGSFPVLSASASVEAGRTVVSVSNRSRMESAQVQINVRGAALASAHVMTLAADTPNAANSAERPDRVAIKDSSVMPSGSALILTLPPCSVQTVALV